MKVPIHKHLTGLRPSATLVINEKSRELLQAGKKIFKLGFGQSPFPVPEVVTEALRQNAHQKDYLPVKGLWSLREAVARHHRESFGVDCGAEDVLIGPGSKELMFLLQLIHEGDLLVPIPSWVSYVPQAVLTRKRYYWLPTSAGSKWMLEASTLEEHCQKNSGASPILILNYPSNPTGSTFDDSQLRDLAAICRNFRILVLSDEIYGLTDHQMAHRSISVYYPEGTIISSGLSKWCGAGGWRLGTFVFPKAFRSLLDLIASAASETFTTTSAPIQYAAAQAYQNDGVIDHYLTASRKILGTVGQAVSDRLNVCRLPHPAPRGGFYLMPDLNFYRQDFLSAGMRTSAEVCERLLAETGVALLPLSDFGMPPDFFGARLSYVDFDGARALEIIAQQPGSSATILAPKVIEGVERMCNWLCALQKSF